MIPEHQEFPEWWKKDKALSIEGEVTTRTDVPNVHTGDWTWSSDRLTVPFQDRAPYESAHFASAFTQGGKMDPTARSIAVPSIGGFQGIPSRAADIMQTPYRTSITYGPTALRGSGEQPVQERMLAHLQEASETGMIGKKRKPAFPGGY